MLNLSSYGNMLVRECCGTLHSVVNETYFVLFSMGAIHGGIQPQETFRSETTRTDFCGAVWHSSKTLAIRTTVVPITPLIGTTVVRISGVIRTTGKSIFKC